MSDSDRYNRDGRYNNLHTDTRKEEEGKKDKYRIERLYIDSEKTDAQGCCRYVERKSWSKNNVRSPWIEPGSSAKNWTYKSTSWILPSGFGNRKGPEHIEEVTPLTSLRPLGLRRQPRSRYGPRDPPWTRRGHRKTGTTDRISRPEN